VLDYFADATLKHYGDGAEGKARAVEMIVEKFRFLKSDIERDLYLKALADRIGIDEALLRRKAQTRPKQGGGVQAQAPAHPPRRKVGNEHVGDKAQKNLLQLMLLAEPDYRKKVRDGSPEQFFTTDFFIGIATYLLQKEDDDGQLPGDLIDHDALTEEQVELISGLLLTNENEGAHLDEVSLQTFEDCCRAVEREKLAEELSEIDRQEKDASANGEDISALQMKRIEINRKLKKK